MTRICDEGMYDVICICDIVCIIQYHGDVYEDMCYMYIIIVIYV